MTNAWTKGPLLARRINSSKTHPFAVINPNSDDVIAHYCSEADAQLFAAAPDMAEALEAACRDADYRLEHGDPFPAWYEPARAAIAKARGEAP